MTSSFTQKTIAIITPDIWGPTRNGGIGTSYYHLALLLAKQHKVTILYTLGHYTDNTHSDWQKTYDKAGITFIPLILPEGTDDSAFFRSLYAYEWLRDNPVDIAHFPDWQGGAYHSCYGKRYDNTLTTTSIIIGLHSPTSWHKAYDAPDSPTSTDEKLVTFMERTALELCDTLISPSQYLLDWCQDDCAWSLSPDQHVIANHYPDKPLTPNHLNGNEISELVFFGRLEHRKGLTLFCDTLKALKQEGTSLPIITFLGKPSIIQGQNSHDFIAHQLDPLEIDYVFQSELNSTQAIEYLKAPGRVAIIASLVENSPYVVRECLSESIFFLTTRSGGTAELLDKESQQNHSFSPTINGCKQAITQLMHHGIDTATPSEITRNAEQQWLDLHNTPIAHTTHSPDTCFSAINTQLAELYRAYLAQQRLVDKLQGDCTHQAIIMAKHQAQIFEKNTEIQSQHKHQHRLKSQINQLNHQKSSLETSLHNSEQHVAQLKETLDHANHDLHSLQAQYQTIISSHSWKITKPLRVIARLLRRSVRRR